LDGTRRGAVGSGGELVVQDVPAGDHAVRVTAPGKRAFGQQVSVAAYQRVDVEAKLAALVGSVQVRSSPGAEVYLDGTRRGAVGSGGELVVQDVPAGDHAVRVTAPGKRAFEWQVNVAADRRATVEAKLANLAAATRVEQNPKDGLRYVYIPPGRFMMGCSPGDGQCFDRERPAHEVTINKGFWLGQTQVTVGAYKRYTVSKGRRMPSAPPFNSGWANENMPMVNVSWVDAQAYCKWAGGRLPTEAEWEYAARAGSTEARYGPIDEISWYSRNSGDRTHEVGRKRANAWGLFDMLGNVWEWVSDWYDENYYRDGPSTDPRGPEAGRYRLLRGATWCSLAFVARFSYRNWFGPGLRSAFVGFRCARDAVGS
jgi:formylglycine-generating enzyme required for sulfatase activity